MMAATVHCQARILASDLPSKDKVVYKACKAKALVVPDERGSHGKLLLIG